MKHHDKLVEDAARVGNYDNRPVNDVAPVNPVAKVMLDHLGAVQANTRMQLDILRKTRGQRNVGEVKIPAHLQFVEPLDDRGIESRGTILPISGAKG